MRWRRWTTVLAVAVVVLTGCSDAPGVRRLPVGVADYQLGEAYPPRDDVTVVVRDSTEAPEPGVYSICYVNAFQSQPGERIDPDLLLERDPEWPDEHLLDTSRPQTAARARALVLVCHGAGYDAVELDNLDSWTRSEGRLDREDTIAVAAAAADTAHAAGLAVGQKNTPELTDDEAADVGFDFAVAEQCHEFDECAAYTGRYGDQVVDIEYTGTLTSICADPDRPAMTSLRDRDLTAPGSPGYVSEHC